MQSQENKFITLLTPREQQAIDNINAVLNGDGSDPESGPGAWGDCGEVDVPVVLDALARLSRLPAPASDEVLAELESKMRGFPKVFITKGLKIGTVAHLLIATMNGNKNDDLFAQAIAAAWNTTPVLAARVRTAEAKSLPSALNDDLIFILGHPNFLCAPYATALRVLGREIPPKAEQEQAAVIHWLLQHYLADQTNWREAAAADLNKAKETVATSEGKEPTDA